MANVVTDFRQALVTGLTSAFPPPVEVVSGRRSGVSRDKDRINVFFEGWLVDQARIVVATPRMIVRYWKANAETPPTNQSPQDPTELEQASVDLLIALRTLQDLPSIGSGRPWYFNVEGITIDEDPLEWGVEARLLGFTANVATIA